MAVIALIGVGKMGEAILAGLLKTKPASEILVTARRPERASELESKYGVKAVSNQAAFESADQVFVLVKPHDVIVLLEEFGDSLKPDAVVVSLAAGLRLARLEAALPTGSQVVRVMPNTPSLVGLGMSIVSAGSHATDSAVTAVTSALSSIGKFVVVPEADQDAMTAVSGSGPAYFFYFVEAMIAAAVDLGVRPEVAKQLTLQTILGSAHMLSETDTEPEVLRANVTSKGGVTAAAIQVFDDSQLKAIVKKALAAATARSIEMAQS